MGSAFGAIWPSLVTKGDDGGDAAPKPCSCAELGARGVEFRDSYAPIDSPVRGPSTAGCFPALRGPDLFSVRRRWRPFEGPGTTMLDIPPCVIESIDVCRVRLSVRRCRIVLSWRTAPARLRLPVLPADASGSGTSSDAQAVSVSIVRPDDAAAACRVCCTSESTQSAGVGGTGPSDVTPLGGLRRVGGEMMGTVLRSMLCTLCDLEPDGGGPGGGGGNGIPGAQRVCDAERERSEFGVSMAPVETARREFGGTGEP